MNEKTILGLNLSFLSGKQTLSLFIFLFVLILILIIAFSNGSFDFSFISLLKGETTHIEKSIFLK